MAHLDVIDARSHTRAQVIFKHSVRCGISAMMLERMRLQFPADTNFDFYYLDIIRYREISNAIASRYGVIHQSPQLIVIYDKMASDSISHHAISMNWLLSKLSER